jgi:hypothetical protein
MSVIERLEEQPKQRFHRKAGPDQPLAAALHMSASGTSETSRRDPGRSLSRSKRSCGGHRQTTEAELIAMKRIMEDPLSYYRP